MFCWFLTSMQILDNLLRNDNKVAANIAAGFLGDINEAIEWLEKAYDEHDAYLCIIKYYPWVPIKLRQDRRFNSFISKMNFPE